MEKVLNVGVCLADYLKKLKDEKPDFQLGAVSLNVMFKNRGSEYLAYSITGDPVLTDDVMTAVCEEDLKDSTVVITEDDPVIVQMTVAMVSKLTNGQITFTDVIYVPDDVVSEEAEVKPESSCTCSEGSCEFHGPFDEEYIATLDELAELSKKEKTLRDKLTEQVSSFYKKNFRMSMPFDFSFLCADCEKKGADFCKKCKNN